MVVGFDEDGRLLTIVKAAVRLGKSPKDVDNLMRAHQLAATHCDEEEVKERRRDERREQAGNARW